MKLLYLLLMERNKVNRTSTHLKKEAKMYIMKQWLMLSVEISSITIFFVLIVVTDIIKQSISV